MKWKTCQRVMVIVAHPYMDIKVPLEVWIEMGPGPRTLVRPHRVECEDGTRLPFWVIPLRYRNDWLSRRLIQWGWIEDPWAHKRALWAAQRQGRRTIEGESDEDEV